MTDTSVPEFSIIIPTRNRPALLRQAIASVLAQTISDFECIIVDDAGSEPIPDVGDARVRVIRRDVNGGQGASLNTGLRESHGRAVVFLDDDDLFTKVRLELAREGLRKAPVAVCWGHEINEPGRVGRAMLDGKVYDSILDGTTPNLGQVALRNDVRVFFDERFVASADLDWWLRVTQHYEVTTTPEVGYLWRRHRQTRTLNGPHARIGASLQLMSVHSLYFEQHPRARAFRWRRIGLMAGAVGDHRLARLALLRSFVAHPAASVGGQLVRALRPSITSVHIDPEVSGRFGLPA